MLRSFQGHALGRRLARSFALTRASRVKLRLSGPVGSAEALLFRQDAVRIDFSLESALEGL
jgi:hypothetical protein